MDKYANFDFLWRALNDNARSFYMEAWDNPIVTAVYISAALVAGYLVKKVALDKKAKPTENWKNAYDFIIGKNTPADL